MALKVIGKPENHDKQAEIIVTGRLDFSADNLPGKKLHARILPSPYAHAKITSIDTSGAEALEGVEAVITYKDPPALGGGFLNEEVFYWGQEVAVVAATDPNIAEEALGLINVDYEELPFVLDPDEAMQPGAPLSGILEDSNVYTTELVRGDVEAGFAEADIIYEDSTGWTNFFQHNHIEPRSSVAWWTDGHLHVRCSSQDPHAARAGVAGFMELPLNKVHVLSHGTGCGFGDKIFYGTMLVEQSTVYAAMLSKKAGGKPVQVHFSRKEHFLNATHQFATRLDIKIGAKNDGTLTAIDATFYADDCASVFAFSGGLHFPLRSSFICPNGVFKIQAVKTNKPRTGAWRCVADPPGNYVTQIVLDGLAEELGMDPFEFRSKTIVTPDMPHQDSGLIYASNGIRECLEEPATAIGWATKWHTPGTKTRPDGRLHGIGLSCHVDSHGQMSTPVSGIINLTRDGKALLNVGITRVGNGSNSAMCHIVAETLGMKYDDVMTGDWGNTDVCAEGGMQGGSTRVITLGSAFQRAAEDVRDQLFERAQDQGGVPPFTIGDGKVTDSGGTEFTIVELVQSGGVPPIVGRGSSWPKELQRPLYGNPVGTPCETRAPAGAACEVAVDPETGEVEVLSYFNADDLGRVIFRRGAENQSLGGIELQIGQCLFYEQIVDPVTGATLNANQLDHKWPTTLDHHQDMEETILVETDDACGPYGAKGIGEPAICSFGAIANAIHNATGVWVKEAPITPQKILKALGKA